VNGASRRECPPQTQNPLTRSDHPETGLTRGEHHKFGATEVDRAELFGGEKAVVLGQWPPFDIGTFLGVPG